MGKGDRPNHRTKKTYPNIRIVKLDLYFLQLRLQGGEMKLRSSLKTKTKLGTVKLRGESTGKKKNKGRE
jgi:hypothetical protein